MPSVYKTVGISSEMYREVENIFAKVCRTFGYKEMIFPTIEFENLYNRTVGEESDIVQKEMFALKNEKDSLVLRPEGTASAVKSYVQNKLYVSPDENVKLFYKGSMFRKERPQAGRQREFTQMGIETIGIDNPFVDAEVISLAYQFFKTFGLLNVQLQINSIGCKPCRSDYKKELLAYLQKKPSLCNLCVERMNSNPLRVLDCKNENCKVLTKDAPRLKDYRCEECESDYKDLKEGLVLLDIPFVENNTLVRGLDYYSKTVFEFVEKSIGAQSTICGGGRYSGLVEELGGPEKSGIGFALGVERLLIALSNQQKLPSVEATLDYYLIWTNDETRRVMMKISQFLRKGDFTVEMEFSQKKLKNQLKVANRKKAKFVLILGEDELEREVIQVKNLLTGEQKEEKLASLV